MVRQMAVETVTRPRGPYSLRLSARLASDATRRFRAGRLEAVLPGGELAAAWQLFDGAVVIRADSEAGAERMRFVLGLGDDHSEFLERFRDDPLLGRATRVLRGLRPIRVATVAHSLLRGLAGQLVTWQQAKDVERSIIRALSPRDPETGLYEPPWSAGVVCLQGLGRYGHGLVGDLGLVKLCSNGGRRVETEETVALLEPYGEWAGLASVYLLRGMSQGLVPTGTLAPAS